MYVVCTYILFEVTIRQVNGGAGLCLRALLLGPRGRGGGKDVLQVVVFCFHSRLLVHKPDTMRLDAMVAPTTVIGLGLSSILLDKSTAVNGFLLSGREDILAAKPVLASGHRLLSPQPLSANSQPYRFTSRTRLYSKSIDDDFIDAIVEEKTAGLALSDEENTSVRAKKKCWTNPISYMFLWLKVFAPHL